MAKAFNSLPSFLVNIYYCLLPITLSNIIIVIAICNNRCCTVNINNIFSCIYRSNSNNTAYITVC